MFTHVKQNKSLTMLAVTLTAVLSGFIAWFSSTSAADLAGTRMPSTQVAQQVSYAGQVDAAITGQYPVTFRFYSADERLVYEETVAANVRQGRFQVFAGSERGDLMDVLRESQRMELFFEGERLDALSVVFAKREDIFNNREKYSKLRAVIIAEDDNGGATIAPQSVSAFCRIVQSGFFTIPSTNTTVGVTTPGCASNEFAVSGGYVFLTTPTQGVVVFGLFPPARTNWQVNYEVAGTPATLQNYTGGCQ
jgi:hypothetical protein